MWSFPVTINTDHPAHWLLLKRAGVSEKIVMLIRAFYDKLVSWIRANGLQSMWFKIMSGVRRVHNVSGLMRHRHGLSTGESSRDRHERHIFRWPFLHRLGLCRWCMPARRTDGVTGAGTWSPSNWGRIFEVRGQLAENDVACFRQHSGCPPFRHNVGARG